MNIENPEIRAKILEWQKRYQIEDGDPALALLELVNFFPTTSPQQPAAAALDSSSTNQLTESLKTSVLPAIERLAFQSQELQKRLDSLNLEAFSKQIAAYHEGIDYCTKKLDVVKKETDTLTIKLEKAAASIKPVTLGAVLLLMGISGVLGYVLAAATR